MTRSVMQLKLGDTVVATYGHNRITKKPFEFLYDFGRYTDYGCQVYRHEERGTESSCSFPLEAIRLATEEDIKTLTWGT